MVPQFLRFWIIGQAAMAMAQSPVTFTATGAMAAARSGHTATLLPNGKVLLAGGSQTIRTLMLADYVLASAELYDPSTGYFTAAGDMTVPRAAHTATLLPNGQVLIAGGASPLPLDNSVASTEIYDPSTRTFTATG